MIDKPESDDCYNPTHKLVPLSILAVQKSCPQSFVEGVLKKNWPALQLQVLRISTPHYVVFHSIAMAYVSLHNKSAYDVPFPDVQNLSKVSE